MTDLVRNVECVVVGRQADVRLLLAIRSEQVHELIVFSGIRQGNSPDESVDLRSLDIVQLLNGILDLTLVRLDINDEHQGVVLLNLLHRGLGVQWPEKRCI